MSAHPDPNAEVHRLLDIVVEEVSLVDRAANKHRFLIVKRSDEMKDTTDNNAATAEHDTEDLNDENTEDETSGTEDAPQDADGAVNTATLTLAVEALEGLTETVELLSTANQEEAKSRLAELATDLRGVSEQIGAMAGASNSGGDGSSSSSQGEGPAPSAGQDDTLAGAIGAVRATLQQVGNMLRAQGATQRAKGADAEGSSQPTAGGSAGISEQLKTLTSELRSLAVTVKEQQQRLARLEKRSGLPNSRPAGEQRKRTTKADAEDVGWPLDMNRSFDRDNVDKSVSFHDV